MQMLSQNQTSQNYFLTHDAADDRGLLGNENVLTIAFVENTWWREDSRIRKRHKEDSE